MYWNVSRRAPTARSTRCCHSRTLSKPKYAVQVGRLAAYAELAKRLGAFGVMDDEKALASRVALGRVRLELFLQILRAIDSELPSAWRQAYEAAPTWEDCARLVLHNELEQIPPMSSIELAIKLSELGVDFSQKTLLARISSGNLTLPEFLRSLVVLRSRSLDPFVEYRDLVSAAQATQA